jgi:hypothetical protein
VILRLEDDVWVNAPIETYNPNFVQATPPHFGARHPPTFACDGIRTD